MKASILTSALLIAVPHLGHAIPTNGMLNTGITNGHAAAAATAAKTNVMQEKRELNLGGLLGPIGDILLNNPIGRVAQELIAEFFKLGDAGLNIPLDVLDKILQGKFGDAEFAAIEDVLTTLGGIPKDIARILGALGDPRHKDAIKQ